jgi:hypothetical protein
MGLLQTALQNHALMQILRETHIVGLGIVTVNELLPTTKVDAARLFAPTQTPKTTVCRSTNTTQRPRGYPAVVFH